MARPRKEIDWEEVDKLCALQCTLNEIAGWFDCSEDTIQRAIKREFDVSFAVYYKKKSSRGKISLRRSQFRLAENNASMAIWLGKQYLGQSEIPLLDDNELPTGFSVQDFTDIKAPAEIPKNGK
tara:strand:- start:744 stop:1115 length:372 start_codon:yes stop_codon:yes gene_type:complete